MADKKNSEKKEWTIQYGLTDCDCKRVKVICKEEDLEIICAALVRYDEKRRQRPIACCAYLGEASFRNYPDYGYCDYM